MELVVSELYAKDIMDLKDLLHQMVEADASDLHIKVGSPPGFRVHGKLKALDLPVLTAESCHALVDQLLDDVRRERYERERELDFSTEIPGLSRFRVNLFHQRDCRAAVLRVIPMEVPELESLGMPDILRELCRKPRGLVLVTGPTGSGKSTTLAAMIDYVNRTEHGHILTLEDPIEFVHQDKSCFVNQREVGSDTLSFSNALRAALREDPDVILVGEMRDLETIGLAITAAETGHLVFGTLHTTSASSTIDRVIDVFPHEAQQQVRTQLAVALQGVVSQTLLPKVGGGRCCAQEIMTGTDAVRNCIREGKTHQLINALQTGASSGMQTLESHLSELVSSGATTPDDAMAKANKPDVLLGSIERGGGARPAAAKSADPVAVTAGPAADATPTAEAPAKAKGAGYQDDFESFRAKRRG